MRARSRVLAVLSGLLLTVSLASVPALGAGARPAPVGQDPITAGQRYSGDFPDPAVLRVGLNYYAFSTTSYGLNVPALTSTDLKSWRAVHGTSANPTGDALPRTPVWSDGVEQKDGRYRATTWAPTVTRIGPGRYVLAYATRTKAPNARMCISIARSTSPAGPFVDSSTKPTVCPDRGAIDPQIFIAPTGRPFLLWKKDHYPAQMFTIGLNADGVTVTPGAKHFYLGGIARDWEGKIIENPAMIRYKKRFYLFYSANSYASSKYAVGYMICKKWYRDCKRPKKGPFMKSGKYLSGPGGATPFVDAAGNLRLAYHAWRTGAVGYAKDAETCRSTWLGCGQRRLYIATLGVKKNGTLKVVRWTT
ncbi:beta-xylosidase [Marmoricola sp. OAE513]|uniref:glycoside hydrolase family 43 protein n=1 Tax=Marmoricola sp. OAE513 TaxID=2817894 RepID=UPI001AE9DC46